MNEKILTSADKQEMIETKVKMSAREIVSKVGRVESELTCTICQQIYFNPYTLHCQHSFCKNCISNYKNHDKNQDCKCPICRRPFIIREGDINCTLAGIIDVFFADKLKARKDAEAKEIIIEEEREAVKRELRKKYQDEIFADIAAENDRAIEDTADEEEVDEEEGEFVELDLLKCRDIFRMTAAGLTKIDATVSNFLKDKLHLFDLKFISSEFQDSDEITVSLYNIIYYGLSFSNLSLNLFPIFVTLFIFNLWSNSIWYWLLYVLNLVGVVSALIGFICNFTFKSLLLILNRKIDKKVGGPIINNNINNMRLSDVFRRIPQTINNNPTILPPPELTSMITSMINSAARDSDSGRPMDMSFRVIRTPISDE